MARRKMINVIRTDTIENRIAFYRARGDYEKAWAWQNVAVEVGAPIDGEEIETRTKMYLKALKAF